MSETLKHEDILRAALHLCQAPKHRGPLPPLGSFWPDIARIALVMQEQQTLDPVLPPELLPALHGRSQPWPTQSAPPKSRAENTARLLAHIQQLAKQEQSNG